jgi:mannose-1-phosphate guanylyltransferase
MRSPRNIWAVVMATGNGFRRMEDSGRFCPFTGDEYFLENALQRAAALTDPSMICTVVDGRHCDSWSGPCDFLPAQNVFVQPKDCGTAPAILLSLLHLEARDPEAIVVLLPADYQINDETVIARSLESTIGLATTFTEVVYLLGAEPDIAVSELGYIVPSCVKEDASAAVSMFVEKPNAAQARRLIAKAGLWNTFILVGSVAALLRLYGRTFDSTVGAIRQAIELDSRTRVPGRALRAVYDQLEPSDFSRAVLELHHDKLRVFRIPGCGWTDLGRRGRSARRQPAMAAGVL